MRKLISILILVALPSLGSAQSYPKHRSYLLGTKLDAVAMNGAPSTRTFTVGPTIGRDRLIDYAILVIEIDFTHANNGKISIVCLSGATAATATKEMTACQVGSDGVCYIPVVGGAISGAKMDLTDNLTGDAEWSWRLGIKGYRAISCVATHSGTPAAGDILTVTGYLVTD